MTITAAWWNHKEVIDHDDLAKMRELLLGHKVAKVAADHLQLDDGTLLRIDPNEGGCACSAGDYELTELNECDNIITAVDVEVTTTPDEWGYSGATRYSVFVVAEDRRLLFAVDGDDGNGYYGTGFRILVQRPEGE